MTGGLVQLVARGQEDNIISIDPQITLFKSIYRRHVNFSKVEHTLTFNNNLTFGTVATCKLKKLADLINRLFLVIELPKIDISYMPLTNQQLALTLLPYNITWTYDLDKAQTLITQDEFNEVVGLLEYVDGRLTRMTNGMINDKIDSLTQQLVKDDTFISVIQTITTQYLESGNTNVDDYIDDIIIELLLANRTLEMNNETYIDTQDYYNQYLYLHSYKNDLPLLTPRSLSFSDSPTHVKSFYDPSDGIPVSPSVYDRYISVSTDRGWSIHNIYMYFNSVWNSTIPSSYTGVHLDAGLCHMTANTLLTSNNLNKVSIGFFDGSTSPILPDAPTINDIYIYNGITGTYTANYIYKWNGTQWNEIIPIVGNAYYITDGGMNQPSHYRTFMYYNGSVWVTYSPNIIVYFDGTIWRRAIDSFYDPTNGLPIITVPDSLGKMYVSLATANGWIENNIYVWDGWEWNLMIPTSGLIVYVEDGEKYSGSVVSYDGIQWNLISLTLPLYNFELFRKVVYETIRDIIYTDSNVNILCGVDYCNTIVIPSTSVLQIRTFFDTIVENTIGTINTNAAVYKLVYNTFFDDSLVGNQNHVISIQTLLSTAIKNCIENIINPDIEMLTILYNRLQHIISTIPDYYQMIYYKVFPNGTDQSNQIINCPRDNYHLDEANKNYVWDYFAGYIMNVPSTSIVTDYITYIREQTKILCGNATTTTGTLYDVMSNSTLQSMLDNFFIQSSSAYTDVLALIKTSSTKKCYNLPSCMNIMTTNILDNIYNDYCNMWIGLEAILPTSSALLWQSYLTDKTLYIKNNIIATAVENFNNNIWNDVNAGVGSAMNVSDISWSFIFQKYTLYTVTDVINNVPLTITNKNAIEYVILSFSETLKNEIIKVSKQQSTYYLTPSQLQTLCQHIDNLATAYLCDGLTSFSTFSINATNILSSNVPELFYAGVPPITSYHLPFDGLTSMTCYLLSNMKNVYNTFYQTVTEQSIYDNIGDPLMSLNDAFVTNSDFYVYGNQMYEDGIDLINATIDSYKNDLTRYEKYGKILQIKNLYLDPQKYKFTYPIEVYVEIQKEIYNNQSIYIDLSTSSYNDVYTNIMTHVNAKLLPLLTFENSSTINSEIYMGVMDVLIESLTQRLQVLNTNPYSATDDATRYTWYDTYIINGILQLETNFVPASVGIIELFQSSIMSVTNPFTIDMDLYQWYEGIERDKISYEITKMNYLFGLPYYSTNAANVIAITPQNLYDDLGNINSSYGSFVTIQYFIKYLMNHVITLSALGDIVPLFKKTIQATSDALISYYSNEKSESLALVDKIHPYTLTSTMRVPVNYSTLEDIIRNIYNKKPVNFAWIKELGHYIIESIQLYIGDALVDQYSGEFMHIMASMESSAERLPGYAKMIGHVPELYTYNDKQKNAYKMYIPVQFTHSKFCNASLPLVCLQHTDSSIRVKLRQFTDVAYWAPMTKFNKTPKLNCFVVADYIYLDNEERMRIVKQPHDILIEQIQYNGDVSINLSLESEKTIQLCFGGETKELYVVCQLDEYVDGTLLNGEKQWNNYLVSVPKDYIMNDSSYMTVTNNVNPIESMKILFNGREREPEKDILWYGCVQRLAHHTASLYDGISVYSFALNPEELQPSGAVNTGKLGYIEIYIKIRSDVVSLIGKQKKLMRVGIYNKACNFLRIRSGLAGLAFYT